MIKQAMKRRNPGFNETYYGYDTFSDLLEEMADQGYILLNYDEDRGNYEIRRKKR